jgi:hypothetical protein
MSRCVLRGSIALAIEHLSMKDVVFVSVREVVVSTNLLAPHAEVLAPERREPRSTRQRHSEQALALSLFRVRFSPG